MTQVCNLITHTEYGARQIELRKDCPPVFSASNNHELTLFGIVDYIRVIPILCACSQELLEPSTRGAENNQVISIQDGL